MLGFPGTGWVGNGVNCQTLMRATGSTEYVRVKSDNVSLMVTLFIQCLSAKAALKHAL